MVSLVGPYLTESSSILDPCAGPGTFFQAAINANVPFLEFCSIEIDKDLKPILEDVQPSNRHRVEILNFLGSFEFLNDFDVAMLNPPYLRHELLSEEYKKLLSFFKERSGFQYSRRMNLYGYFILATASKLKEAGVLCAIIYDSLENTSYGKQITDFLEGNGSILSRTKVYAPFDNVMVDAEIILWVKSKSSNFREFAEDELVNNHNGLVEIGHLARVKRGTSFLKREYFVSKIDELKPFQIPFVTKQPLEEGLIVKPNSAAYLSSGDIEQDAKILDLIRGKHKDYRLEAASRLSSPVNSAVLFNYYIRNHPRHLLNTDSIPASDNFYCIEPMQPERSAAFWFIANSSQVELSLIRSSRNQGSGLRKLQLFEYSKVLFPDYTKFDIKQLKHLNEISMMAASRNHDRETVKRDATQFLKELGYE